MNINTIVSTHKNLPILSYINDEIKYLKNLLHQNTYDETLVYKTIINLENILIDLNKLNSEYIQNHKLMSLSTTNFNDDIIKFSKMILTMYANMYLTETESYTKCPTLPKRTKNSITEDFIIKFTNELYENELQNNQNILNKNNIKFFYNSFFYKKSKGCLIYNNYVNNKNAPVGIKSNTFY